MQSSDTLSPTEPPQSSQDHDSSRRDRSSTSSKHPRRRFLLGGAAVLGLAATGTSAWALNRFVIDHTEITEIAHQLADRYEGDNVSLSIPSTRVDAFTVDLARELSRGGRRSGLTIAPEAGSERLRAVINKNVSEDDLMATVSAAFGQGWRSVKMYFMCGLPTETDEDMLAIARLAHRVVETGRRITGRRDIACTVSIGGFVPKAHTPFQWAPQADPELVDHRIGVLREAVRADRGFHRAITVRWSDGEPGQIEGLLARGDRRVGRVIEAVWLDGGRFDGWREHYDHQRWVDCAAIELEPLGVVLDWYTTRERDELEVLPWDHLDAGLDRGWLWQEYLAGRAARQLADCRWDGCEDCGVCPRLGVDIEMGPSGTTLLPLEPPPPRRAGADA